MTSEYDRASELKIIKDSIKKNLIAKKILLIRFDYISIYHRRNPYGT